MKCCQFKGNGDETFSEKVKINFSLSLSLSPCADELCVNVKIMSEILAEHKDDCVREGERGGGKQYFSYHGEEKEEEECKKRNWKMSKVRGKGRRKIRRRRNRRGAREEWHK